MAAASSASSAQPMFSADEMEMAAAAAAMKMASSMPSSTFGKNNNDTSANGSKLPGLLDVLLASDWDLQRTTIYTREVWLPTAYKITLAYLLVVFLGQRLMKNRPAFDNSTMSVVLAVWNFAFSVFSGWASYRLLPELLNMLSVQGFQGSYCNNANYYTDPLTGYWGWMFVMSKMPELGDTIFLILRKKPVIFLHWYHHALTFLYATLTYAEHQAWCRWSLVLNLSVHTIMYSYFGLQAIRVKTPRFIAKSITTIQILQFVIQCSIYMRLLYIKVTNIVPDCAVSWNVLGLGAVMYFSYLYLFAKFFYDSYLASGGKKNKTIRKKD